tara:strand:+ start:1254 stop:1451 length:198 start_codon:yes stop_codon:yes gene_type:complete
MTPEEIRDRQIKKFTLLAKRKYDMGQKEHGGLLTETVNWKDLEDEVIDLWFYVCSMREKESKRDL